MNEETVRLDSYLSDLGFCARRKAGDFLLAHKVELNGNRLLESGFRVPLNACVKIDGQSIKTDTRKYYILLNKPQGYLCASSDQFNRPLALSLIDKGQQRRLFNVGRLDFDSCGLIFFTNDGDFAYEITHPSKQIEKEYYVETNKSFTIDTLNQFKKGIEIDSVIYKLHDYKLIGRGIFNRVNLTLIEGKNREIREVFKYFGCNVKYLQRIRIGSIAINGLAEGFSRELSSNEVSSFLKKV